MLWTTFSFKKIGKKVATIKQ